MSLICVYYFKELRVAGNRCFDMVSRLLLITPHSHVGVDAIFHLHCCAKADTNCYPIKLDLGWSRVGAIFVVFNVVGKKVLPLSVPFVVKPLIWLGSLAKAQAQQAQNDLR